MTAKLIREPDSQAGRGIDKIAEALERLSAQAIVAEQSVESLNAELQSDAPARMANLVGNLVAGYEMTMAASLQLAAAQQEMEAAFSSAIDAAYASSEAIDALAAAAADAEGYCADLADSQMDLQSAADDTSTAASDGASAWESFSDTLGYLNPKFALIQGGLSLVSEYVVKMAEDGDQSFQKLIDAGSRLQESFEKLAESDRVSNMIESIAEGIEEALPYIEAYVSTFIDGFTLAQKCVMGFTRFVMMAGEAVGLLSEGTVEAFDEEGRLQEGAFRKRTELGRKEKEEKKQEELRAKAEAAAARYQDLTDPGARLREEAQQQARLDAIAEIEDEAQATERINRLLEQQKALVDEITKRGKDPLQSEEVIKNRQELVALESRRNEILRENQRLAEAAVKQTAAPSPDQLTIQQIRATREEAGSNASRGPDGQEDGKLPAGFRQQFAKMRKGFEGNQPLIARQVIKNREEAALSQWRAKQKTNGRMSNKGFLRNGGTKYEEHKVRAKARSQAMHDIRQGNVSHEEGQQAVSGLTDEASRMIKQNGKLDQSQIEALEKLTAAANKQAREAAQLQDQLDKINERLNDVTGRRANSATRHQRAGG